MSKLNLIKPREFPELFRGIEYMECFISKIWNASRLKKLFDRISFPIAHQNRQKIKRTYLRSDTDQFIDPDHRFISCQNDRISGIRSVQHGNKILRCHF